jgi:hypothetical protein
MVNVKEKIEKGYIHTRTIIEMAGVPKEYIEETLKKYVENIKAKEDYIVLNTVFEEAEETEDKLFLAFVDIEMLAKDMPALAGFCFDYMPSSIEIIAPEELKISRLYLSHIMSDLQGKLHKLDFGIKQINEENLFVKKNIQQLLRNFVFVVIGKNGRDAAEIAALAGMEEKDMHRFLENLAKQEIILKEGDLYKRKNAE